MLTPNYLEDIGKQASEMYNDLELKIIQEIAKRITNVGYANTVVYNDTMVAQEMGMVYQAIVDLVAEETNKTEQEIENIFTEAGIKSLQYDDAIYKEAGLNPIPIQQSGSMLELLTATAVATSKNLSNLCLTTADNSQTQFYNAINLAYLETSRGTKSYTQAILDAIDSISTEGTYITYPSRA